MDNVSEEEKPVPTMEEQLAEFYDIRKTKIRNRNINNSGLFLSFAFGFLVYLNPPKFAESSTDDYKKAETERHVSHINLLKQQQMRQNGNDTLIVPGSNDMERAPITFISEEIAREKEEIKAVEAGPDKGKSKEFMWTVFGITAFVATGFALNESRICEKSDKKLKKIIDSLEDNFNVHIGIYSDDAYIEKQVKFAKEYNEKMRNLNHS